VTVNVYDQHERDADEHLATYGLRVPPDVLPTIRAILIRETRHEADTYAGRGGPPGNTALMRVCAAQLWHGGAPEDALLVHRARRTSMDATGALDAELMLGAGPARTREYLTAAGATEALDDIAGVDEPYDAGRYAAYLDAYYPTVEKQVRNWPQ
jgi:hypothetical protein